MLSIVAVTTKIQLGGETSTDKPLIFKPGSNEIFITRFFIFPL